MISITIRPEETTDCTAIYTLVEAAFRDMPVSDGSEPDLLNALRTDGDLALSLVAVLGDNIVGHIAFSAVSISDGTQDWFGLGPVAVRPELQGQAIGSRLIRHGISSLHAAGAQGIVLLGNPDYYCRFSFEHDPELKYPGPPAKYFQRLVLDGAAPKGIVSYARAFG